LIEGSVWVDKYTGEIQFDPIKNRDDHRHHAIDALVISLTKESYFQQLSKHNASKENKKRNNEYDLNQLNFPKPWADFHEDAKKIINGILVSHKQNIKILTKISKKIIKNGKTFKSEGMSVRGQLHDRTFYGQNKNCLQDEYVYRVAISKLSFSQLTSIVDFNLKEVIVNEIFKKLNHTEIEFFKMMISGVKNLNKSQQKKLKDKVDKILKETSFFMPNEGKRYERLNKKNISDLERVPVPIKKVRVKKVLGNAQRINDKIKQYVDPQKNHHVLIYKDSEGNYKEEVVIFIDVAERKRTGQSAYQLPTDGKEIVTTLHINDMFLLGLKEDEVNWENPDYEVLKEHLYRVQSLSSKYYEFRQSINAESQNKVSPIYEQIRGFGTGKTGWDSFNPIKVKISVSGKIQRL
jgi:CRISPR-associated endonuclease Csn1